MKKSTVENATVHLNCFIFHEITQKIYSQNKHSKKQDGVIGFKKR